MHHYDGFHGRNICKCCCDSEYGSDALVHYARCAVVKEAYTRSYLSDEWQGGLSWLLCLDGTFTDSQLAGHLRFLYAMFMASNICNHNAAEHLDLSKLIVEYFKLSKRVV